MIKIALTGPESSGKTTLAELIAQHYKTTCVPEFAREFIEKLERDYNKKDLVNIAEGHLKDILSAEERFRDKPLIVVDTDFIVIDVWSRYKYGETDKAITALVESNIFDLHILCEPDIPWENDVMRENPNDRDSLFILYKETLETHGKSYIIVNGSIKKRKKKAIKAIELL